MITGRCGRSGLGHWSHARRCQGIRLHRALDPVPGPVRAYRPTYCTSGRTRMAWRVRGRQPRRIVLISGRRSVRFRVPLRPISTHCGPHRCRTCSSTRGEPADRTVRTRTGGRWRNADTVLIGDALHRVSRAAERKATAAIEDANRAGKVAALRELPSCGGAVLHLGSPPDSCWRPGSAPRVSAEDCNSDTAVDRSVVGGFLTARRGCSDHGLNRPDSSTPHLDE